MRVTGIFAPQMETDFSDVTEVVGEPISREQLFRLNHRYAWAAGYCAGKDVAECGCGTGPGLGLLSGVARSFQAGDISPKMVGLARRHYGQRISIMQFSAEALPYPDNSLDVLLLFEAIYYVPDASKFVAEAARVLRDSGRLLIVTANKDLWDFHPSPYTHKYYGVRELGDLLKAQGFDGEYFGFQDTQHVGMRERVMRPLKRLAVMTRLMPQTMAGKRWLKRIVFGADLPMPAELSAGTGDYPSPEPIPKGEPDRRHKIIYCAAIRTTRNR